MKKNLFLISFILCSSISTLAQGESYVSKINLESVKLNTSKKINKLLLKYSFPKDYEKTLESNIYDFEYNRELYSHKYSGAIGKKKTDSLTLNFENWREHQALTCEKANKLWKKTSSKHNLDDKYRQAYIDYHFYKSLKTPSAAINSRIRALAKGLVLKNLSIAIARQEAKRVLSKCSALENMDAIVRDYAGKELYDYLKSGMLAKLSSFSTIQFERNSDVYCTYAYEKAKVKQAEIDKNNKRREDEAFVEKAVKVGLKAEKAYRILLLIEKRNAALEARKKALKTGDSMSELFANTDIRTKSEIKNEFAKALSRTITRKQFAGLFGNLFTENFQKKTDRKMIALQEIYKLNEEQITDIGKMVATFYFNEEVIAAYYSFDKNLKKQKLSALRFHFEKDYKKLMSGYGLKAKTVKKAHKRTYLWD